MPEPEPISTDLLTDEATEPVPWAEGRAQLAGQLFYWHATVRPDGTPHVRPVLAVWLDGALCSTTSPAARKGRNLDGHARCSISTTGDVMDLVVEGIATRVRDQTQLESVAEAYATKYGWPVTVEDGAFFAPYGAPTAGPPPYEVYEIVPVVAYAFSRDEAGPARSTRWRFAAT